MLINIIALLPLFFLSTAILRSEVSKPFAKTAKAIFSTMQNQHGEGVSPEEGLQRRRRRGNGENELVPSRQFEAQSAPAPA
jgi:hypothetical protein